MREPSPTKQKILLLLMAGLALGFAYTPGRQIRILKQLSQEWAKVDKKKLNSNIRELYQSKLVETKANKDGSLTFVLTGKGRVRALTYHFANMRISKKPWDGFWRIIVFDIPEKLRPGRDALREKLVHLGFYELQKSVLIFPYECKNEIEFLIEFFDLRKYVRYGVLKEIDNELHLKKIFHLV